jgi:beta-galactosidase
MDTDLNNLLMCQVCHTLKVWHTLFSALSAIPHGKGKVILCALDIFSCIKEIKMEKKAKGDGENASMTTFNTSQKNSANIVGRQLLLNLLEYLRN